MPQATPPLSYPLPPAPVPVQGQCAPLSEQSTPWEIFIALARVGMHFLIRFLPFMATLARNYPRHWRAFLESSTALVRVLLTVRFAPERITKAQLRRLWRARQLIESLFGRPLPIFPATAHQSPSASPENATPLGARTSPSAIATAHQHPSSSLNPAPATPLGARTPPSATTSSPAIPVIPSPNTPSPASPGNPQSAIPNSHPHTPQPRTPNTPSTPSTPAVPQVPFCSLSHFPSRSRSDADSPSDSDAPSASPSRSSSRAHKHASASLQAIIAQLEAQEARSQSQPQSPHSAFSTPHSSILPPFIPDVNTLHAALKADTLPPNCAGALLDKPADTLVKALQQVHALLHAFPQLSPSPSPSQSSANPSEKAQWAFETTIRNPQSGTPQSDAASVHSVHSPSPSQSEISNLKSEIPNPQSAIYNPQSDIPHSTSPP